MANPSPRDVQATLAEFTATEHRQWRAGQWRVQVAEVYVCGGGAHNTDLMRRLHHKLAPARLDNTAAIGMDPNWVEAATFAWLASQTLAGVAGNAPVVTGAAGPRVLGGIYPGGQLKINIVLLSQSGEPQRGPIGNGFDKGL